jgi:hypothetical protein
MIIFEIKSLTWSSYGSLENYIQIYYLDIFNNLVTK